MQFLRVVNGMLRDDRHTRCGRATARANNKPEPRPDNPVPSLRAANSD